VTEEEDTQEAGLGVAAEKEKGIEEATQGAAA